MANKQIAKKWHDATIQNNFVFGKTMELYPDLCRRLLELILNTTIKEISYPEREKTIEARTDSKGIRLDVYVEEKGTNRSFDVEMQIANSDNIDKRMRYYQGLIDMDKLITLSLVNLSSYLFARSTVSSTGFTSILSPSVATKILTLSLIMVPLKFS